MAVKLAIFDMDGTILDTLGDLCDSLNYVLAKQGYPVRTLDEVRSFVGNGIAKLIERAVPCDCTKEQTLRVYEEFIPYEFLDVDDAGELHWNAQFLFACDDASGLAANRQAMWQECTAHLQAGAY